MRTWLSGRASPCQGEGRGAVILTGVSTPSDFALNIYIYFEPL
jgi:hypothetical protein